MFGMFGRGRNTTGVPLGFEWDMQRGRYGGRVMFDGKRAPHLLVIGPNGSGKGTRLLILALLEISGRSIVVIDPKGELAAVTAAWRRTVGSGYV
jgi:type IV secretory pathway TraG/TraD family ATPase VirD4